MDRLTDYFTPENYELSLDISKAECKVFSGEVEILGEALHGDFIKLHSKDLAIDDVSTLYNGETIDLNHKLIPENDELQIDFVNAKTNEKI